MLGETDAVELLDQSLAEEKEADATLTEIAERTVNLEATSQGPERAERRAKAGGRR
jgi:ferritin-like metal-binding protein YciE